HREHRNRSPHTPPGGSVSKRRLVRLYALAGLAAGIALTAWVVQRSGARLDWTLLARSWPLVIAASAWFALPLLAASESWRCLFPRGRAPAPGLAIRLTWIGFGVNWLLPVAAVGGEVVKFRLGLLAGCDRHRLAASLVADKTLQVATQILYLLLGAGLLLGTTGTLNWRLSGFIWLVGFALAVGLFYRAQNAGLFSGLAARLARIRPRPARAETPAVGAALGLSQVDAAIRRVYRRRRALLRAALLRMAFRVLMAGEIALIMIGLPLEPMSVTQLILSAVVLESLAQGARAMAFFVPAGLGAQEGALIGAGVLLGLPADSVLLVAVIKRGRELLVGLPALLAWQAGELCQLSRSRVPAQQKQQPDA
ncbi:MAG: lysylphosphatidylglycerol synthase domain-containing protein, partial [Wenzhouxiangellaceae bacterium]